MFTGLAENSEKMRDHPCAKVGRGFAYGQVPHFTGHRRTAQANYLWCVETLPAQFKLLNERAIAREIFLLEVIEKATSLADDLE